MGKNKLQRFKEIAELTNVLELTDFESDEDLPAGQWNNTIFEQEQPITLELACGKGEYTVELARKYPDRNFIGVDIKGARIWKGAKKALEQQLNNVRFLRIHIDHIDRYFAKSEVDEIWITFPDPYLKPSKKNKRLTSPKFLDLYKKILKPGSPLHLKTDSDRLFNYSVALFAQRDDVTPKVVMEDVYREKPNDPLLSIQTYYEKKHLRDGKSIKYLSALLS